MMLTPLELLNKELTTLQRDLRKTEEMYLEDTITKDTYMGFKNKFVKKIVEYEQAIKKLLDK